MVQNLPEGFLDENADALPYGRPQELVEIEGQLYHPNEIGEIDPDDLESQTYVLVDAMNKGGNLNGKPRKKTPLHLSLSRDNLEKLAIERQNAALGIPKSLADAINWITQEREQILTTFSPDNPRELELELDPDPEDEQGELAA